MNTQSISNGLPDSSVDYVTLYITAPTATVGGRLQQSLERAGLTTSKPLPQVLATTFASSMLTQLSAAWADAFDTKELSQTRCQLTVAGEEMSPARLMHSRSLRELRAWIEGRWLDDLLHAERLITFFQPIVRTADPTNVFAYECLTRGLSEDSDFISADRLFGAARETGLLAALDEAACLTAIDAASFNCLNTHVFINFNPRWIDESKKCLNKTIVAINDSGIPPERFVFEVVESDEITDLDRLVRILDLFSEQGYRVALDDIGDGYSSLTLMSRIKPDYIKLDMGLVRDVDRDSYKSCVASKLLELARELDLKTVVEGVERPDEWEWAVRHGADYAQGYLFARPAAVPPHSEYCGRSLEPVETKEIEVEIPR